MAWDTEKTRSQLLDAAANEFARAGFAGARVDAIATEAGVNKERIYSYFGNKQKLFDAVLAHELAGLFAESPVLETGPDAIGEYAACLWDAYAHNPRLPRLLAWEGLERPGVALAQVERSEGCAAERAALQRALPGLEEAAAGHLLLTILSLVGAWWSLEQLPRFVLAEAPPSIVGGEADRRAALVTHVTAIAAAASLT